MALQDLTPQLRTRLNRMERAVGWFLFLAMALLVFGFSYYIYKTAESRGWFKEKAKYFVFVDSAKGLTPGVTRVELLGKEVGLVTDVQPQPARGTGSEYNVYVEFEITEPYFGYVWTEGSIVSIASENPLNLAQVLSVSKGTNGYSTYLSYSLQQMTWPEIKASSDMTNLHLGQEVYAGTNLVYRAWQSVTNLTGLENSNLWIIDKGVTKSHLTAVWNPKEHRYEPLEKGTKPYYLQTVEEVPLTDRLQAMVSQVEAALPDITNKIALVLANAAQLTSNLNVVANNARPAASNLSVITANLREPKGSLGEWLIPTNINAELASTLSNANTTITNADTNILALAESIQKSLDNLASITSNLNAQVQANTNVVRELSDIIIHTDEFVQGLKRHWLLRSAFKTPETNQPAIRSDGVFRSPRENERR